MVAKKENAPTSSTSSSNTIHEDYSKILSTLQEGTHLHMILSYLIKHGSITPKEAEAEPIDCHRLSGRILDLRRKGVAIDTISVPNKKRRGTHAKYILL